MLRQKLRPGPGPKQDKKKKKSKSIVKNISNVLKTESPDSNFPGYNERNYLDMLEPKVDHDQLMSVDINMEDVVDEVIMDSDENEEILPKTTEE